MGLYPGPIYYLFGDNITKQRNEYNIITKLLVGYDSSHVPTHPHFQRCECVNYSVFIVRGEREEPSRFFLP